ncbi:MAG: AMP-binding protein [Trebonia sp.]
MTVNYTIRLLDRLAAGGERDAIVQGKRRISGLEARSVILRFAATLSENGMAEGDGIALFVVNSPEALLLKIAIHFLGCRLVFVPPEPGNSELTAYLARADVKMLIFDTALGQRAAELARDVQGPAVFSLGEFDGAPDFLSAASERTELVPQGAGDGSAVCTLFYTGGTTGSPKLVTHRTRYYDGVIAAASASGSTAPDPRTLICTLLTHASGHVSSLMAILTGHVVVLMDGFDAGVALSVLAAEQITTVVLVPPMLYDLLDYPDWPPVGFPHLETINYTGAPAAPSRLRQAIDRFGLVMHQFYGSTEHGVMTQLGPEEHDLSRPRLLSSCGKPVPGVDIELRDESGQATATGQVGEVHTRGGLLMEGYWRQPEQTSQVLVDGWFRTGDLAYQDEEGYLYLVDRAKDIIVAGAAADNVYSRLLDDFLCTLPGIGQAAAIGVPDADYSEAVHVFLVPSDGVRPDLEEVRRRVVEKLGDLYEPKSFSVVGTLPRTTVGKIDKKALRAAYPAYVSAS